MQAGYNITHMLENRSTISSHVNQSGSVSDLSVHYIVRAKADNVNICFNVLLLHCWFIAYIYFLALYDVSCRMFAAIIATLERCATLVMQVLICLQTLRAMRFTKHYRGALQIRLMVLL